MRLYMLGLVFMFFPYFIYITHFTKFTRGSFLLREKSLLVEKSKAEESPWLKKNNNRPKEDFQISTKEVAINPNLSYLMLKARFPFLYGSTSLDTKTLTMASNHNFQSCLSIHHLAPRHIFQFSIFAAGFSFTFGNFANYCVVLLNVPLNDRNKKKERVCDFPGIIDAWRSRYPIGLRFQEAT